MNARGYFDHAATTPLRPEALDELVRLASLVGNPSALHRSGQLARRALEEAREELAEAVGAHPTEVIFTSGGSEADSIAVLGGWAARRAERPGCLVSAVEHPAVVGAVKRGAGILPVTAEGVVDLDAADRLIDAGTGIVSVMAVGNETGTVQPAAAVAALAAGAGAWFHTDAVQALGHIPLDFATSGAHLMSLSAHKVGGPVGVGALLCRREVQPAPIGLGGGQERGLRSGTVPVALAASFARAASVAVAGQAAEAVRLAGLRDRVADLCLRLGGRLNSLPGGAPHIVNVTFDGVRADDLLFLLDQAGIRASVGSACRAGVHQPSEVLLAMGRTLDEATQSLRFSLGWTTTDDDVEALGGALAAGLQIATG
ncbi:cysteine desulfurase family protein [Tessaracoccus flavus]|jgi:cysteine desulfurase|uniref:Class V aminotransferase n=1 Tax=Tessaracoccus flavus TaxID=1610493 RepID=A0A1Q2CEK7_9ACTN|nr:cysteine desulfurase family protein [Tessaracoccus flavus]AQP44510.1 class V aminotransferase [Tessaracoccus flavus]SDY71687.1 cysteine desulfurase [Tessaracoccus flavus]